MMPGQDLDMIPTRLPYLKKKEKNSDLRKACEYTKPPEGKRRFQYQFGLTMSVINGPTMHWFTDGDEKDDVQY